MKKKAAAKRKKRTNEERPEILTIPAPAALPVLPPCPDHLAGEARTQWQMAGTILAAGELLTDAKLPALAVYCVNAGRHIEAEREIAKLGTVVKSPAGFPVTNPYLAVSTKAAATARQLAFDLGLLSRSAAKSEGAAGPPTNDWKQRILDFIDREAEILRDDETVVARGVPWNAAAIAGGPIDSCTSAAISRALTALEKDGKVSAYRPSGRVRNVKLLEARKSAETA